MAKNFDNEVEKLFKFINDTATLPEVTRKWRYEAIISAISSESYFGNEQREVVVPQDLLTNQAVFKAFITKHCGCEANSVDKFVDTIRNNWHLKSHPLRAYGQVMGETRMNVSNWWDDINLDGKLFYIVGGTITTFAPITLVAAALLGMHQCRSNSNEAEVLGNTLRIERYIDSCASSGKFDLATFKEKFKDTHFPVKISKPEGNIEISGEASLKQYIQKEIKAKQRDFGVNASQAR